MIRKYRTGAALVTVLGGALLYIGSAVAQAGLDFQPLAQGLNFENHVRLKADGPSVVLTAKLGLAPLGEIPWHYHPGPAIVTVIKGTLTEYHANGCVTQHPAGTAFFEEAGEVHKAVNASPTEPGEAYVTFILPAGTQPLIPTAAPRNTSCTPGHSNNPHHNNPHH